MKLRPINRETTVRWLNRIMKHLMEEEFQDRGTGNLNTWQKAVVDTIFDIKHLMKHCK